MKSLRLKKSAVIAVAVVFAIAMVAVIEIASHQLFSGEDAITMVQLIAGMLVGAFTVSKVINKFSDLDEQEEIDRYDRIAERSLRH